MGRRAPLGLEGAQIRPGAWVGHHVSVDEVRIVPWRTSALWAPAMRAASDPAFYGSHRMTGGVRQQGQDLSVHQFLVDGVSRAHDGGPSIRNGESMIWRISGRLASSTTLSESFDRSSGCTRIDFSLHQPNGGLPPISGPALKLEFGAG